MREVDGPPGAPMLLLLHGWTATADLNWYTSYESLGRSFRVIALDHRGHGRGIRSRRPFRLTDCAEDAATLLELLGSGPAMAVGYSMGGPIAQLLWRRHPELVSGLVLCATSRTFASRPGERMRLRGLAAASLATRALPRQFTAEAIARAFDARRGAGPTEGWASDQLRRNNWTAILEAGGSLGRFDSRPWISEVDVPAAVVATMNDELVAPARQLALARSIRGARVFPVQGDHAVCVTHPKRFVPALVEACQDVAARAASISPAAPTTAPP